STPASCASCGRLNVTVRPSSSIVPSSGMKAPDRHLMRLDFPAPLSPITARTSPSYRSRSQASRATTRPNTLTRPRALKMTFRVEVSGVSVMSDTHLPDPLVDGHRQDDQDADHEGLVEDVIARQGQAVAEDADDQRAEKRPEDRASATEQARAADDHRGDGVQVGVRAGVGTRGVDAPDEDPRGDREDQTRRHVHTQQHAVDADARQAGSLRVVADGVDMPAPGGTGQHVAEEQIQHDHDEHTPGEDEPADLDGLTGPREQRRHGLAADG